MVRADDAINRAKILVVVNDRPKARCGTEECALTEKETGRRVTGRGTKKWSMRASEEKRKARSQLDEAVNDWESPNTAGHVAVACGRR